MKKTDIARLRLSNQQLTATAFTRPDEIVSYFGAMQAQDYPMAKWAIGVRLPGTTETEVEAAIAEGQILRTHLMRPTWHFTAAADIRWLLALTAPHVRRSMGSMLRLLELDAHACNRSNERIARALEGGKHLTRPEIMIELEKAGIKTSGDFRLALLMICAELDGVVCSGIKRGNRQTYALLDERVPKTAEISRDEAVAELTKRYFTSHAPATLKDFVWWSGLPTADARKGLEMNKSILVSREIDAQTYYFPASLAFAQTEADSFHLLPAFDEFMVSYKDRTASLAPEQTKTAITGNGIFKPVIVTNGKIAGIWKRSFKKDSVVIEKTLFGELNAAETESLQSKALEYAAFEGKNIG
jgi:hypothetical protein